MDNGKVGVTLRHSKQFREVSVLTQDQLDEQIKAVHQPPCASRSVYFAAFASTSHRLPLEGEEKLYRIIKTG